MSQPRSPAWLRAIRCPGSPGPRCAARDWQRTTPASWMRRSAPTPAARSRLSWRSPARTQAARSLGRETGSAPASSSIRRSPSTSVSTQRANLPAPRPMGVRRGRRVSHSGAQSGWQSPHAKRADRRGFGRRGTVQSSDRPAPVRLTPDGANARCSRVRQASNHLPRPARCRGGPAPGLEGPGGGTGLWAGSPRT